jgi:hypothetical protein
MIGCDGSIRAHQRVARRETVSFSASKHQLSGTVGKSCRYPIVGIDQHSWVLAHKEARGAGVRLGALALLFILGLLLIATVYV